MPYDLYVRYTLALPHATHWQYRGTYPKLWLAQVERNRAGQEEPELTHWTLFYVRRTTGSKGSLHSQGEYERKEDLCLGTDE